MRISEARAVEIARAAVRDKCEIQPGSPIEISYSKGRYIVTFKHLNPPGIRGADFDAQVTLNASSGEVIAVLGGP
jgi:hypothetical protein